MEIEVVMELSELKHNLDGLRLVGCRQTPVFFSLKNAIAALKDKVRADWVLLSVESLVPVFLLWQEHYCFVVFAPRLTVFFHCLSNVTPDVRCVVPV